MPTSLDRPVPRIFQLRQTPSRTLWLAFMAPRLSRRFRRRVTPSFTPPTWVEWGVRVAARSQLILLAMHSWEVQRGPKDFRSLTVPGKGISELSNWVVTTHCNLLPADL